MAPVAPFVTSLTDRVFAVHTLGEEPVAALFARYSRAKVGFRELLAEAIAEGDVAPQDGPSAPFTTAKARAFHAKWVNGYGHGSVGEHATVHLAMEGVSVLAAKLVEDARIGTAFTEKSTRYVRFDRSTHLSLAELGIPTAFVAEATVAVEGLLGAYGQAVDALTRHAARAYPDTTETARNGWVFDRARALLPCAIPTSLGVTLNGRSAAALIRKLRASELPEGRALAEEVDRAAGVVLPTLIRHTEAEPGRKAMRERLGALWTGTPDAIPASTPGVSLRWHTAPADWRATLVAAIVDDADAAGSTDTGSYPALAESRYRDVLHAYLGARGTHERPGRALEALTGRAYVVLNYGAWRDVQRHRMFSAAPVRLHPRSGMAMDETMGTALGHDGVRDVKAALRRAQAVGCALYDAGHVDTAQYVLPLGTLVHSRFGVNARSLFQFVELRSGVEGHDDYRVVAHQLADRLHAADPVLAAYLRVNRAVRVMARK